MLCSQRPPGTPEEVITDSDPERLLDKIHSANRGGDVHLVGGTRTTETFRALAVLDKLALIVLPLMLGGGVRLTEPLNAHTTLTFESARALPSGAVEIVYDLSHGGE